MHSMLRQTWNRLFSGPQASPRRLTFRPRLEALEERTVPTWVTTPSLPTPRFDLGVTTGPDGRIYAEAGADLNQNPLPTNEVFNPATNGWTVLAPMPIARSQLAAAVGSDGRIFVIGGNTNSGTTNSVEAYNISINAWSDVASMNTFRQGLAAARGPDGRIYAIGGAGFSGVTNVVEAYNANLNLWVTVASMPTPRTGLAAVTGPDGRIYAIGGEDSNGKVLNTVEAYNVTTNTWASVPGLFTARTRLAGALAPDGRIFAIGGTAVGGTNLNVAVLANVEAFNVSTNGWTVIDSLPTARDRLGAATGLDNRVYAVGGRNSSAPLATVEAFAVLPPPNPKNPLFVAQIYLDLLHRPSDPGGQAGFTNLLNAGAITRLQMVQIIESSVEFKSVQVQDVYSMVLHRGADPAGLNGGVQFLAGGGTVEQLSSILAGSTEYFQTSGGTNAGFINALYLTALNRSPDPGGQASAAQLLASGASRIQVATILFTSPEHALNLVNALYVELLRRPADPGGLTAFSTALVTGARDEDIIAILASSDEYINRL